MNGSPCLEDREDRRRSSVWKPEWETPSLGWNPGDTGSPAVQESGSGIDLARDSGRLLGDSSEGGGATGE